MHELCLKLNTVWGALEPDEQQDLYCLLGDMVDDFNSRWGNTLMYANETIHGHRTWLVGIPTYAYWSSVLDP